MMCPNNTWFDPENSIFMTRSKVRINNIVAAARESVSRSKTLVTNVMKDHLIKGLSIGAHLFLSFFPPSLLYLFDSVWILYCCFWYDKTLLHLGSSQKCQPLTAEKPAGSFQQSHLFLHCLIKREKREKTSNIGGNTIRDRRHHCRGWEIYKNLLLFTLQKIKSLVSENNRSLKWCIYYHT